MEGPLKKISKNYLHSCVDNFINTPFLSKTRDWIIIRFNPCAGIKMMKHKVIYIRIPKIAIFYSQQTLKLRILNLKSWHYFEIRKTCPPSIIIDSNDNYLAHFGWHERK